MLNKCLLTECFPVVVTFRSELDQRIQISLYFNKHDWLQTVHQGWEANQPGILLIWTVEAGVDSDSVWQSRDPKKLGRREFEVGFVSKEKPGRVGEDCSGRGNCLSKGLEM